MCSTGMRQVAHNVQCWNETGSITYAVLVRTFHLLGSPGVVVFHHLKQL